MTDLVGLHVKTVDGLVPLVPQRKSQVDVFTVDGVWTKPFWATTVQVILLGGGGGGGAGARAASGTASSGGQGGGGGGRTERNFLADDLPESVSISVAAAGLGGAGRIINDGNGANGSGGLTSHFGTPGNSYAKAAGGNGGTGGQRGGNATAGGQGGAAMITGGQGGSGSNGGAGNAAVWNQWIAGGGGGGGIGVGVAAYAGGGTVAPQSSNMGPTGVGGTINNPGTSGGGMPAGQEGPGVSGGGGGGSVTGPGGDGGNGGNYGGAGGGGGSSLNGQISGKGGDGSPGLVVVISRP